MVISMKYALFPLTPEAQTIARYAYMMKDSSIVAIASFQEDERYLQDLNKLTGIYCTTAADAALRLSDAVVLMDNTFKRRTAKYCSLIDQAIRLDKKVFATPALVKDLQDENYASVSYIQVISNEHQLQHTYKQSSRLLEVKTPVVVIAGMGENCSKFECQLDLRAFVDAVGYNVFSICSNSMGGLMGMSTFPAFMFDENLSFSRKVMQFNRYVYDLCDKHKPNLLLIGLPSGIVPLSECDTNYFSEIPLAVSYALQIDAAILSFYYMQECNNAYLESMDGYCSGKYEIPVEAFYMSRQRAEYEIDEMNMKFLFLSDGFLKQHPPHTNSKRPIAYPLQDNTGVYRALIRVLQQNLETV